MCHYLLVCTEGTLLHTRYRTPHYVCASSVSSLSFQFSSINLALISGAYVALPETYIILYSYLLRLLFNVAFTGEWITVDWKRKHTQRRRNETEHALVVSHSSFVVCLRFQSTMNVAFSLRGSLIFHYRTKLRATDGLN